MTDPDVVIPVRRGDANEELRYALRSLSNLPHGDVWICGHAPWWVTGVRRVPSAQGSTPHTNVLRSIGRALAERGLAERLVLWNDDFFLLRYVQEVPLLHRGPAGAEIERLRSVGSRVHANGMSETVFQLIQRGVTRPLSYELHVPLPASRVELARAVEVATTAWDHRLASSRSRPPMLRTLCANLAGGGGRAANDVKVTAADEFDPAEAPTHYPYFLSTNDEAFNRRPVGEYVRDLLPGPSPYEKRGPRR